MSTSLREKIRLQELQNEAKKLELELTRQPSRVGFTADEWVKLAKTAGGCFVTIPIMGLLFVVLINPELMETYDQLISGLVMGVVGFYLGKKIA